LNKIFAAIIFMFVFAFFADARYIENVMSDEEIMSKINEMSVKLEGAKNKKEQTEFYEEFARMFFLSGAYDAATNIYKRLLESNPPKKKKAEYYIKLGDIEAEKKSYNTSLDYYNSALALYKKNNDIKKKIGDMFLESNLYGLAEQSFKDILANDKNSDYAKRKLGDIYYSRTIYSKALEYYESINRTYYDKELIIRMAAGYKSLNNLDKAVQLVNDYININPDSDLYLLLGSLYSGLGKLEEAKEQYLISISIDPSNFSSYVYLAAIYLDDGDIQKAEEMLDKANLINSYTAAVDMMYARIAYKKGRLYEARRYAANAVLKSKTPFVKQQAQRMQDYFNKEK